MLIDDKCIDISPYDFLKDTRQLYMLIECVQNYLNETGP